MSDNKEPENTESVVEEQQSVPTPKDVQPAPNVDQEAQSEQEQSGTDWKAHARLWQSRAEDNQAELSEKEKQLDELQQQINKFQAQEHKTQARVTVADELGIPVHALNGISGETPEDIKSNAEALLSLGKRSPHIPNIGDAPKAKRTTAEIFADHIRSQNLRSQNG